MKETELREPVRKFFEERNFVLFDEAKLYSRRIDVVAKREAELIAIELKLHAWTRAIEQAYLDLRVANYSFVALPESKWSRIDPKIFRAACDYGIGLLSVDGVVRQVMRPRRSASIQPTLRRNFLRHLRGN